ncbi:MAG TPA: hypothetical protein VMV71_00985 [Candidatus Paceibacterota bacterium]|nr:hypothetical protein [Candidatus Paceibacterota bacterium]
MYFFTARIRWFWWLVIFYLTAVTLNMHCVGLIFKSLAANKIPSDVDLWAVAASGLYIFAVGFVSKFRPGVHFFVKLGLFSFGLCMLAGTFVAFYIMYYVGTSLTVSVLSLLFLAVMIFNFT